MYKNLGSADGHEELDEIKATCERHADLCRQYAKCSLDLQMNDAQLEILSETAETLRQRHAQIRRTIDEKPHSPKELEALEAEVASVIRQVAVWTMELEEVNASRLEIEVGLPAILDLSGAQQCGQGIVSNQASHPSVTLVLADPLPAIGIGIEEKRYMRAVGLNRLRADSDET
nr:Unknown [Haemonchus contortus]